MTGQNKRMIAMRMFAGALLAVLALSAGTGVALANAFNDPTARGAGGPNGGGDFAPVEQGDIKGGDISIGSTSQVVVLFRNDSGRPVTTGAIQLYPSSTVSAAVTLNQCSQEEQPAGSVCAVAVSVKGLQAGAWRVEMIMRHSGRTRLARGALAGNVDAGEGASDRFISDVETIPAELDFGKLETSQPIVRGVVLRNITSEPIDISAIYAEAADRAGYSIKTDCAHLDPGQACIVTVTWSPVLKGQATGILMVEHTGPTKIASINLKGDYTPSESKQAQTFPEAVPGKGLLVSSQETIDFGADVKTASAITVSLVNVGDAPLTISGINMASTDNGMSVSKTGCVDGAVLEPVEACPLTLMWSPVREGAVRDDIRVMHDGARGVLILPVKGDAASTVSQDNKAVRLSGASIATISPQDSKGGASSSQADAMRADGTDPASVLDGFTVTSHAPTRAIISGPGGSRIVFNGEQVVIGGFVWHANIRASGVEFSSGESKVLLLFDRSLSSLGGRASSSSSSSSSSASSSPSSSSGGK